jgi:hypothetical protein
LRHDHGAGDKIAVLTIFGGGPVGDGIDGGCAHLAADEVIIKRLEISGRIARGTFDSPWNLRR